MNKIDLVIPMVFPADPEWQRAYAAATDRPEPSSNARFRSWGTEELLVKCCMKYMPWIRTIHILLASESQMQMWMADYFHPASDWDGKTPTVNFVFHREFIPREYLPCFASPCIEMFLDLIPGLSDNFIYANDDMFPLSPLQPYDFFKLDGRPCMHITEEPVPAKPNIFQRKCIYQQNMIGHKFNWHSTDTWLRTGHGLAPIMKSACEEVWRRHWQEIELNLSPLKRTDHSWNHYIFELLPYFCNWYCDYAPRTRLIEWNTPTHDLARIIEDKDCGILCINDNDAITDWQERAAIVREAIEKKLETE